MKRQVQKVVKVIQATTMRPHRHLDVHWKRVDILLVCYLHIYPILNRLLLHPISFLLLLSLLDTSMLPHIFVMMPLVPGVGHLLLTQSAPSFALITGCAILKVLHVLVVWHPRNLLID